MGRPFAADLIVLGDAGSPPWPLPPGSLVVTIRLVVEHEVEAAHELRAYMLDRRCAVGLLASADRCWLYRGTYSPTERSSVEMVKELSTVQLLGLEQVAAAAHHLEASIYAWLVALAASAADALPAAPIERQAVIEHVVPFVTGARVAKLVGQSPRPKDWHCVFCGRRARSGNDYYCDGCSTLRPFQGGNATMVQCDACGQLSLICASFCEWCGHRIGATA